MLLLCCHILALREKMGLNPYDENLMLNRWKKNFYLSYHRASSNMENLYANDACQQVTILDFASPTPTAVRANKKYE